MDQPNPASKFLGVYAALNAFVKESQGTPLGQLTAQALSVLSPTAADLMLQQLTAPKPAEEPPANG